MQVPCRVQLFGGLRVQQGDRVITRFRTQKTALLLGYLARHAGRMHPREVLVELLWPGCEPDASRNNLSTALSSLRRQLEPPGSQSGAVIQADRQAVGLNPAAIAVDALQFEAGLRAASTMKRGPRRTQLLCDSVDLYRGEFLSGFYDDWVILEQRRLAEACCQAIAEVVSSLENQGDLDGSLRYAWVAVSIDPLREEAHRDVIRLYALAGQPESAIRQYHELESTLARQLQATPSDETVRLRRAIERGAVPQRPRGSGPPARTAGPALLPSGTITFVLADGGDGLAGAGGRAGDAPLIALFHQLTHRHGGIPTDVGEGTVGAAFGCANDAVACVLATQARLAQPVGVPPSGGEWRFALDTGQTEAREGGYRSSALSQARRLLLAAHPGQVVCSARTAALVQPDPDPSTRLVDLGAYRLRADGGAEHVFQAERASVPARRHAALGAPRERAGNLPVPLTRFIGRQAEIAGIQRLVAEEGSRLVTLTGPAGCGKTRLAVEAAHRLGERLPGGVWFVPAGDLAAGGQLPEAIRDALRLRGPAQADPLADVVEALRDDPALLLLDNVEHVAPEAARVAQALLERTSRLACLCTSRMRLQVPGEREWVVAPLATPGDDYDPARVVENDSVRLFLDRAQAAQPDFQVTRSNAAAVAALCVRLDGLPLALEVAAARAQILTPAQMVARLGSAGITSDHSGQRHHSLREAFDWSYAILSPQLRRFFDQLSIFRAGCTADGAQAVCQEPLALDLLGQLRGSSLLQTEVQHPETRFRMLETLREYGASHLAAREREDLARRHAEHYLNLAETGLPELFKPAQTEWLSRLAPEQENLRAAIAWGLDPGGDGHIAARLVAAIWPFWYVRGRIQEGRRQIGRVLSEAGVAAGPIRGRLLAGGGALALVQGDLRDAARLCREALPFCRDAGDTWGTAVALSILGMAACSHRDLKQAEALYREALETARAANDVWCAALAQCGLADCARERGAHHQAVALAIEGVELARASHDRWLTAWGLGTQGIAVLGCGDGRAASALCRQSLAIFVDLGDLTGAFTCLEALAQISGAGLHLARAARLLGAGQALRGRVESEPFPEERKLIRKGTAILRTLLGKARFQAEWERGHRTAVSDLLSLVADEDGAPDA